MGCLDLETRIRDENKPFKWLSFMTLRGKAFWIKFFHPTVSYLFQVQCNIYASQCEALNSMRKAVSFKHRHTVAHTISRVKHHTCTQQHMPSSQTHRDNPHVQSQLIGPGLSWSPKSAAHLLCVQLHTVPALPAWPRRPGVHWRLQTWAPSSAACSP